MRCVWALGPLAAVGVMPWHVPPLYPPSRYFQGLHGDVVETAP